MAPVCSASGLVDPGQATYELMGQRENDRAGQETGTRRGRAHGG